MSISPGTLLGPYEIVALLGAGGMGEVYRARDARLERDVAIKVLPSAFAADNDRLARFDREAKAVAALSHPNVIAIFDTGVHESQLYVVMELLEGSSLRDRLGGGPIPVRKAVDIAVRIARGLGAAHGKGIVHRDLKPENIFLVEDGQVKILDFGLARQAPPDESGATETMQATDPGTVLGTVGYMAPEQVRGLPADARADVFAFGAVLYEMLSGRRGFARETAADTMTAILTQDPPELTGSRPDLSPALDRIVRHCLEKNPNERFQSARDIAFALESLTGSASGPALAGVPADGTPRANQRARARLALAAVGIATLSAAAGYFGRGQPAPASAGVADVTYQPVTFEEGFVFAARFGPDNRTVVYSADWDRQARGVFVTSLESPAYRPLGFPGADLLAVSRAGDLAILNRSSVRSLNTYFRTGTLATSSLTGTALRDELDEVSFADLGPNNALAVVRESSERWTVEYPVGRVLAEHKIDSVDRDEMRGAFATPRVSPTGDHVAFFETGGNTARVHIVDRSGQRVAESRVFADWWSLAWPTSTEVWFAASEAGRQTAIFSLDLAGRERRVFRAPGAITLHDISPQGDVLVSFDRGVALVESLDANADRPRDRSWREEQMLADFSSSHTLLLTGVGDSGGPQGSVYVWKADDPEPVRISDGWGRALSADGRRAVVASGSPRTFSIVPTGAGQPQNMDAGPITSVARADWLPDGRLVIQATRPGEATGVFLLSAEGRDPAPLLPAGVALGGHNVVAPDGSRLVAMDGARQLLICTMTAPSCRPFPGSRAGDVMSGWRADGLSVFVYQPQPMQVQVDEIEVASGRRSPWKTVRPLNAAVTGVLSLIAAPDGALAYDYDRHRSQLYVIKGLK